MKSERAHARELRCTKFDRLIHLYSNNLVICSNNKLKTVIMQYNVYIVMINQKPKIKGPNNTGVQYNYI